MSCIPGKYTPIGVILWTLECINGSNVIWDFIGNIVGDTQSYLAEYVIREGTEYPILLMASTVTIKGLFST